MRKKTSGKAVVYESGVDYESSGHDARPLDFTTDPEVVLVVVEGERLTYGHLFYVLAPQVASGTATDGGALLHP